MGFNSAFRGLKKPSNETKFYENEFKTVYTVSNYVLGPIS